jgi:hypothetical protein
MSENSEDKPIADAQPTEQPKRRLFIFKAAAILAAAAAVTLSGTRAANADAGFGHQDTGGSHGADGGRRRRRRRWTR